MSSGRGLRTVARFVPTWGDALHVSTTAGSSEAEAVGGYVNVRSLAASVLAFATKDNPHDSDADGLVAEIEGDGSDIYVVTTTDPGQDSGRQHAVGYAWVEHQGADSTVLTMSVIGEDLAHIQGDSSHGVREEGFRKVRATVAGALLACIITASGQGHGVAIDSSAVSQELRGTLVQSFGFLGEQGQPAVATNESIAGGLGPLGLSVPVESNY